MPRFTAATAPAYWRENGPLAAACDDAGLNAAQAEAALLCALGGTYADVRTKLGVDREAARGLVRHAAIRLERGARELFRARVRARRAVLQVMRRGPLPEEREPGLCGVTPASHVFTRLPAAKPHGAVAEDCLPDPRREPRAFLRAYGLDLSRA